MSALTCIFTLFLMRVSAFPAHMFVYMCIPWYVRGGLDRESEIV